MSMQETNPASVGCLFEVLKQKLGLSWIAGKAGKDRAINANNKHKAQSMLIGYMNCVHPSRIQVIGQTELNYLHKLSPDAYRLYLTQLFETEPAAVVVCDNQSPMEEFVRHAEGTSTPLLSSSASDPEVIDGILHYLNKMLAGHLVLHGVFLEVVGIGVLITGESGIGKSELALELLNCGHRLIADDAPQFTHIPPDVINGSCPRALQDFLEVRGLGILNIRAMFGDSAIKLNKNLRLIVHLKHMTEVQVGAMDRLKSNRKKQNILGVEIPKVTAPVAPGRNMAVIVESAARNQILLNKGYDATERFIKQQAEMIRHNTP